MTSYVRNELNIFIEHENIEQFVMFSDMSIKRIDDFRYFHDDDENKMFHFNETIDEN